MKGIKWHYILLLGLPIFVAVSVVVFWPEPSARQILPTPSELVIPWDEAKDYAGEIRIVEGRVLGVTTVNRGITSAMVDYHRLCTAVTPAC